MPISVVFFSLSFSFIRGENLFPGVTIYTEYTSRPAEKKKKSGCKRIYTNFASSWIYVSRAHIWVGGRLLLVAGSRFHLRSKLMAECRLQYAIFFFFSSSIPLMADIITTKGQMQRYLSPYKTFRVCRAYTSCVVKKERERKRNAGRK